MMRRLVLLASLSLVACSSGPQPLTGAYVLNADGGKPKMWTYCDARNQNNLVYANHDGQVFVIPKGCDVDKPVIPVAPVISSPTTIVPAVPTVQGRIGATAICTWTGWGWSCPWTP